MGRLQWKITHTPYNGTYGTPVVITDYYDPMIRVGLGDVKDSFEFKRQDNEDNKNSFNTNDKVLIQRKIYDGAAFDDDDTLLNGVVRDVPEEIAYNKSLLRIKGYNFSETLMNALTFIDATNLPINEAFQAALSWVSVHNTNFQVTWNPSNPTKQSDGVTDFPLMGERFYYKSITSMLEKYSASKYTDDGDYYWFVDNNNTLVWQREENSISTDFDERSSGYQSLKISKDLNDVRNFIIMRGGYDFKNAPISYPAADYSSISKHGFKYLIYSDSVAYSAQVQENDRSKAGVDSNEDLKTLVNGSGFYPTWDASTNYTSWDTFNTAFRAYIQNYLKTEGSTILTVQANGKLSIDITFSPLAGFNYPLGAVIDCYLNTFDYDAKPLRIQSIQYTNTTDTYTMTEDTGSI